MRFVIDANLSPVVADRLGAGGQEAVHVVDLGLLTASDEVILAAAAEDDRVIVSADADFAALLALGSPSRRSSCCGRPTTSPPANRPTCCSPTSRL